MVFVLSYDIAIYVVWLCMLSTIISSTKQLISSRIKICTLFEIFRQFLYEIVNFIKICTLFKTFRQFLSENEIVNFIKGVGPTISF